MLHTGIALGYLCHLEQRNKPREMEEANCCVLEECCCGAFLFSLVLLRLGARNDGGGSEEMDL